MTIPTVSEPIPIHLVSSRYLLHDANHVAHLRRTHNITGVHIGGLPQAAQQNVFLGLPVELMPEEAALLVEKGAAYIVDDTAQHTSAFLSNGLSAEEKARFQSLLRAQGDSAAEAQQARAEARKDSALQRIAEKTGQDKDELLKKKVGNGDMDNWNDLPDDMLAPRPRGNRTKSSSRRRAGERSASSSVAPSRQGSVGPPMGSGPPSGARTPVEGQDDSSASLLVEGNAGVKTEAPQDLEATQIPPGQNEEDESLFSSPATARKQNTPKKEQRYATHGMTPTTSYPPLQAEPPTKDTVIEVPKPKSYPLYKHLNAKGYFLAPGLRFGCQYMAYAGDPLRYHSHFLCNGKEWDEEWDLMELVGGGRLGTGVKKGFLLGGVEPKINMEATDKNEEEVRTFVVEWAGM
ncbi:tRNA intron endonucleasen-like protein [Elsinoe fawcettii]|nr:tRNA intron endonucleasen-like protein [Elsinoe fawcettii]